MRSAHFDFVLADAFRHFPLKAVLWKGRNYTLTFLFLFSVASCSYFNSSKIINGSEAPEISLPDINGKNLTLSSFKGKLVLIEFWASWCKPCREENPKVVALYDKYKNAAFANAGGLEILSVSLDNDREKWLHAIQQDNLAWEHHVSDLQGWKSTVVDSYQVSSIPASFLVDPHGVVIGKNLKPRDLDKLLAELLKQ